MKALVSQKIAVKKMKTSGNRVKAEVLEMTTKADDRDTVRTFKFMYKILLAKNIKFDPLSAFSDQAAEDNSTRST